LYRHFCGDNRLQKARAAVDPGAKNMLRAAARALIAAIR